MESVTDTCCHVAGLRSGRYCSRQGRMPRSSTLSKSAADGRVPGCCCPSPPAKARLRAAWGALCWPWPPAPCMLSCMGVPELFLFRPLGIGPEPPAVRKGPYMASNALHSTNAPLVHKGCVSCKDQVDPESSGRVWQSDIGAQARQAVARVDAGARRTSRRLLHPWRRASAAPLAGEERACGGLRC